MVEKKFAIMAKTSEVCEVMVGVFIVLLAAFFFCFQNVIVRILFAKQHFLGLWDIGGWVSPSLSHSFLLLVLRMVWVVPLMAVIADRLYPPTWREVHQLWQPQRRWVLGRSLGCGFFMFLYLVLLYFSISLIPTSIALTLFFTYPLFTTLLAWRFLNEPPNLLRWGVMALTLLGTLLIIPYHHPLQESLAWLGILLGVVSGIAHAAYIILVQQSVAQLHPVPLTWLNFTMTLLLSGVCLLVWQPPSHQLPWLAIALGSLLSGLFTFVGHVLTNWGILLIGASRTSILSSTNPALTAILAGFTINENLDGWQILGIGIVTLGIVLLSFESKTKTAITSSESSS